MAQIASNRYVSSQYTESEVDCAKCSQPIGLTDIIESNNGRLSHANVIHSFAPYSR